MKSISQWKPVSMHPLAFAVVCVVLILFVVLSMIKGGQFIDCHKQQTDCLHACDSLMKVIEELEASDE